jgi:lipopolysaccharide/colanic/teichoic acid biosynthesis glycosyltransferase
LRSIVVDAVIQRLVEWLAALAALIVLCPALLVMAALIRLTSPGPALHRAPRAGQGGRLFTLYKFRSMTVDAAQRGPGITVEGDARVTPLGRWLRRSKLDELPQLLNVLAGDMSLVGPRPEDPRYIEHYSPEQRQVLAARPGLTSPASLCYRDEAELLRGPDWERTYLTVVLPDKLRIEREYLAGRTWLSDLKVLWQTALALVKNPDQPRPSA